MNNSATVHNLTAQSRSTINQTKKLGRKETAQYIADMVLELRNLAKAVEIKSLQDLLELCFYEAFATANKVVIPEGEIERLHELSKASITP
jgi:hypothetical protein